MPKPFANAPHATVALMNGEWLLGIQTGNNSGDSGLPQMKYIKLSELTSWVRSNFGQMWNYRGEFSASLPSDPQVNDYFLATASFSVGGKTYEANHLYAYNGSSWDDISGVLTQYASQSQVTDIDDRLTVVEVKVDAMGDGIVYKGEVATYADLAGIVDPQTGWEYYVTGEAAFYVYNGASWDRVDNGIVQTITDGDISHAPSADAVHDALQVTNARIENLEQEHGSYNEVTVKSPYTVPSGKAKNWLVNVLRGVTRAKNNLIYIPSSSRTSTQNGVTFTDNRDGSYTVSGTATADTTFLIETYPALTTGHSCLMGYGVLCVSGKFRIGDFNNGNSLAYDVGAVYTATSAGGYLAVQVFSGATVNFTCHPTLTDLTIYFNGTIPSDADTISEIQTNYPWLLTPSSYGTSMVKTRYEGFTSVGVNIWDEEWEDGVYSRTTGEKDSAYGYIRSKNFIRVTPNTDYYFLMPSTFNVLTYDLNKNLVRGYKYGGTSRKVSMLDNEFYVTFYINVSTYSDNIQICSDSVSDKTTYHPYSKHTLSLPTPITLRRAGSVAEEAYLNEDGEAWKTNPLGFVDFTDSSGLSRSNNGGSWTHYLFYFYRIDIKNNTANLFCSAFSYQSWQTLASLGGLNYLNDYSFTYNPNSGYFYIRADALTSISAFNTAMAGNGLLYELATPNEPTPLTPVLNNLLPTEAGGSFESVLTNSIDDSMTLGYLNL